MMVEICALTKRMRGKTILDNVNLAIANNRVVALRGVNGSGKTMLLRAMAGLVIPSSGTVSVDGKVLGKGQDFPGSIGLLIENPAFLEARTGLSNLKLLASIRGVVGERDVRDALVAVGLDPDDRRKFGAYSLGMKQRLGIAAATMENPDLILLDEPTNALDESGMAMLADVVQKHKARGATIVIASHDGAFLHRVADATYCIAKGCLRPDEGVSSGE